MPPQMGPGNRNNARFSGKSKPKNIRAAIKRLLGYVGKDKYKVIFAIFCVIVSSGASLAGTYMLRPIIDNLGKNIPAPEKIQNLILGVVVMSCICKLVNKLRVTVECEDDRLILCEDSIILNIGKSVRMSVLRLELHEVNYVNETNLNVRHLAVHDVNSCKSLERRCVTAASEYNIRLITCIC